MATLPDYEALSYTWGEGDADLPIVLNGRPFLIRKNLHAALVKLRYSGQPRLIWADALCINQEDEVEKNHPVWQMSAIYTRARAVVVWLGEVTEATDRGIKFMRRIHDDLRAEWKNILARLDRSDETLSALLKTPDKASVDAEKIHVFLGSYDEYAQYYRVLLEAILTEPGAAQAMEGIFELWMRPWWKRMWTLQESVLCSNIVCQCGNEILPIDHLDMMACFSYYSISYGAPISVALGGETSLRGVLRSAGLRTEIAAKGRISMMWALDSSWNRRAHDSKDKIMGLLGLVGGRRRGTSLNEEVNAVEGLDPLDLELSYSMTTACVYSTGFAATLLQDASLHGLGFMSEMSESRNPALPSWVPDFELHSDPVSDHLALLSKPPWPAEHYDASLTNSPET